jgi:acyl-CoA reductase-like NAD-dependent aldehyde dehydrogenase
VGWDLKGKAGKKKVVLELGGNAAVIVDRDADLDDAVDRIVFGAFYQSGQSCIGVQRIIVHADIYDALKTRLVDKTKALVAGDPHDRETFIGPMIDVREARRLDDWIREAVEGGGKLLCGGRREGAMLEATLLEGVDRSARLYREEAFGPVAILSSFTDFEAALDEVNDSRFGLQAGLFTRDLFKALDAWDRLDVGGVVINDVPSYRVDNMPYGGVKDSGLGREGVRFAMEDMTEIRNLVIRRGARAALRETGR